MSPKTQSKSKPPPLGLVLSGVLAIAADLLLKQFAEMVCRIWFIPLWALGVILIVYGLISLVGSGKQ